MTREANLTLKDSYIDVAVKTGDVNSRKSISYEALAEIFQSKGNVSSPFLPGEFGLQKYIISGNREYYLYLEQPRIVTCNYSINRSSNEPDSDDFDDHDDYQEALEEYHNRVSQNGSDGTNINKMVAPILAFMVALNKRSDGTYSVSETKLYAMQTPIYSGKEPVYRAPFSNVYDDGRICWGHNAVQIPQLKAIQGLSTLFFGAPFNTDLDENRFTRFNRSYVEGTASLSLHLQMEMNAMLKDPEKTPDDALAFVNSIMRKSSGNIESKFREFTERN